MSINHENKSFIGVSLDNQIFFTDWLFTAINSLLNKHDKILFLIADDLLRYTRSIIEEKDKEVLDLNKIEDIVSKKSNKFINYLNNSLLNLTAKEKEKIEIKRWRDFEDSNYIKIFRNLIIAFYNINEFREDVYSVAHSHVKKFSNSDNYENLLNSSAIYIIDEISMAIRVSEIDNYINEYYPTDEVSVLKKIYNNSYNEFGLTVDNLIGKKSQRKFKVLNILNK